MRFSYLPLPTRGSIASLGGARLRYRPIVAVRIFGPNGSRLFDGCVDSASDDTIFPSFLARSLGIDLTGAPRAEARPVAGVVIPYFLVQMSLRITDGLEQCDWQGIVGFADQPLRWALLGHAGFLNFFDTELRGAGRELILNPNPSFPGHHVLLRAPSP